MVLPVRQQARICLPGFNHTMRPGPRQERLFRKLSEKGRQAKDPAASSTRPSELIVFRVLPLAFLNRILFDVLLQLRFQQFHRIQM